VQVIKSNFKVWRYADIVYVK